jgi:hypothetical protein
VLNVSQHLAALTIASGGQVKVPDGASHAFLRATQVSLSGTAKLDLFSNDLIVDYTGGASPAATIESLVKAGYNAGNWLGNGVTSSTAAANPGRYTLGVLDNATSATPWNVFDGVSTSSHRQVLVKSTWLDDFDLDGLVTSNDAIRFAANYTEGKAATRSLGDLNYNGVFDSNDAILFAAAYNESLSQLGPVPNLVGAPLPAPGFIAASTKSAAGNSPVPSKAALISPSSIARQSKTPVVPTPPPPVASAALSADQKRKLAIALGDGLQTP